MNMQDGEAAKVQFIGKLPDNTVVPLAASPSRSTNLYASETSSVLLGPEYGTGRLANNRVGIGAQAAE